MSKMIDVGGKERLSMSKEFFMLRDYDYCYFFAHLLSYKLREQRYGFGIGD